MTEETVVETQVEETPVVATTEESSPNALLSAEKTVETEEVSDDTVTESVTEDGELTLESYDLGERNVPEELLDNYNDISLDTFKEKCLELGVTPEQAKGLLGFYDTSVSDSYGQITENNKQAMADSEKEFTSRVDAFKDELGGADNFDKTVNKVNALLKEKGFSDEELDKDGFNNSIIGIKLVNELLGKLGEDTVINDNRPNSNLGTIDEQLKDLTHNEAYYDFGHKDHQLILSKINALQEQKLKLS